MLLAGDETGEARCVIIMDCRCRRSRGRDQMVSADGEIFVEAFANGLSCRGMLDGRKHSVNVCIGLLLSGSREDDSMCW